MNEYAEYAGIRLYGHIVEPRAWLPEGEMLVQLFPWQKRAEAVLLVGPEILTEISRLDIERRVPVVDQAFELIRAWKEDGSPDVLRQIHDGKRKIGLTEVYRALSDRYAKGPENVLLVGQPAAGGSYYSPDGPFPNYALEPVHYHEISREVQEYARMEKAHVEWAIDPARGWRGCYRTCTPGARLELGSQVEYDARDAFYRARLKAELDARDHDLSGRLLEGPSGTGKTAGVVAAVKREIAALEDLKQGDQAGRFRRFKAMQAEKLERMGGDMIAHMEQALWAVPTEEDRMRQRQQLDREDRAIGKLGRGLYDFLAPASVGGVWVLGAAAVLWLGWTLFT